MSAESSNVADWSGMLTPPARESLPVRLDDPRIGEAVEVWAGDSASLRKGRPVLLGFPQDEGVRRNGGRVGAALAPPIIRRWLYRLCDWGANLLDLGDLIVTSNLEASQVRLGRIVEELVRRGCIPVVLGGGHETVCGTYLGLSAVGEVAVMNVDAHLDVRPLLDGLGHSGSPFRQMMEHKTRPLAGKNYTCLGAQMANTSAAHWAYVTHRGGMVVWADDVRGKLVATARERWDCGLPVHLSIDADVVRAADVPGVSAPAPVGLTGDEVAALAQAAGRSPAVGSLEVVEINPRFDVDDRSARWAAVLVWNFLVGVANRGRGET